MANSPASIRSVRPATGPSHQSQPAKPERGFSAENQLFSSTVPSGSESTPWLNAYGLGPAAAGLQGSSAANPAASTRHCAALRAKERSANLMTVPPVCVERRRFHSAAHGCADQFLSMCVKGAGMPELPHRPSAAAPGVSAPASCSRTMLGERGSRMATKEARRGLARIALAPKLVLIVASVGALMATTLLVIVTTKTSGNLIQEFESKGEAIALSLAFALGGNGQGTPAENVGRAKGLLDASRTLNGVSYIYIQDREGSILAHTFVPSFPPEFVEQNWIEPGELARSGRRVKIAPRKQIETAAGRINAIDVAAPIAHGNLGVVHVGMNWGSIERTVAGLRSSMLLWSAGVAAIAIVAGFVLAAAMVVRPIRSLTRVTTYIAEHGDLTQRIEIDSTDEIGQLAASFSRMVGRLSAIHGSLKKSAGVLNHSVVQLGSSTDEQEKAFGLQAAALLQAQATAQQIKDGSVRALERAGAVLKAAERAAELGRAGETAIETSFAGLSDIRGQVT